MHRSRIDEHGGMEGVPLQLIIVVVIGVAALGILVGWLALSGDPDPTMKKVSVEPETITLTGDGRVTQQVDVKAYVYDNKGDEVDGVVISFSGAVDDKVTQVVDSGGAVRITAALPAGIDTGTITVSAQKGGGMGSAETTIIVVRG